MQVELTVPEAGADSLAPDFASRLFNQDATFCVQPGNSGQGFSFGSVNFANKYLRHFNFNVYIASNGGSNTWDSTTSWAADTTWLNAAPWA